MKIIDTHLHIWNFDEFHIPWLEDAGDILKKTYTLVNYENDMQKSGAYSVEKAVYVEVDVAISDREYENAFIIKEYENLNSIIVGGIISGCLEEAGFLKYLDQYDHPAIKGVRQVLHVDSATKGTCLKPTFIYNMQELGRREMVFEACLRIEELNDLFQLALKCPNTIIVLNHMGNVDAELISKESLSSIEKEYKEAWYENIRNLASVNNVICKISGLNPNGAWNPEILRPAIDFVLDEFGEDRVIYASNYPVCNTSTKLLPWIEVLNEITKNRGSVFREKLFYENAKRVYKL